VATANAQCTKNEFQKYQELFNKILDENMDAVQKWWQKSKNTPFDLDTIKNAFPEKDAKFNVQKKILGLAGIVQFDKYRDEIFANGFSEKEYDFIKENIPVRDSGMATLEENHKAVFDTLKSFCKLMNDNNVDYVLAGALPCYLQAYGDIARYHQDIDFLLNDKDLEKVQKLINENTNYNLLHVIPEGGCKEFSQEIDCGDVNELAKKGMEYADINGTGHEICAIRDKDEFHVGFFPFERTQDGKIIRKTYIQDKENGAITVKKDFKDAQEFTKENSAKINLDGIEIPCSTVESVMEKKSGIRNAKGEIRPKEKMDKIVIGHHLDLEAKEKDLCNH